jgi:ketosteroid isomerase-like protein
MTRRFMLCLAALALSSCAALAQGAAEQQVRQVDEALHQAIHKGDVAAIRRALHPAATAVRHDGSVGDQEGWLKSIQAGRTKWDRHESDKAQVKVHGDTAVVTRMVTRKGKYHGKPVDQRLRMTRTYARSQGKWRLVSYHATQVVPAK